jgi:hypothetical protein
LQVQPAVRTPNSRRQTSQDTTDRASAAGPTGATGAKGDAAIQFAYLGCYGQSCTSPSNGGCGTLTGYYYAFDTAATNGGFKQSLTGSSTQNIDAQCAALCISAVQGANFFGTVTTSATTGDCYCGGQISNQNQYTGLSGMANCQPCPGQSIGLCGKTNGGASGAIAIFARAF